MSPAVENIIFMNS